MPITFLLRRQNMNTTAVADDIKKNTLVKSNFSSYPEPTKAERCDSCGTNSAHAVIVFRHVSIPNGTIGLCAHHSQKINSLTNKSNLIALLENEDFTIVSADAERMWFLS